MNSFRYLNGYRFNRVSAADPKASVPKMCKLFCIVVLDVCGGGEIGGGGGEKVL